MFILCSPHNPVGRVWSRKELSRMADICLKHNVLIISDEIHNDLVFSPHKHIPIAGLSPEIDDICVTCHAPSKTFNLAGLSVAYVFTKSKHLKTKIAAHLALLHVDGLNPFGLDAMVAAYNQGDEWLSQLMTYIGANHQFAKEFFAQKMPMLRFSPLEATYLLWIDFRALGLNDKALRQLIIEKAGLGLNHGPIFGNGGSGFQRMNIACPRETLIEGLTRLNDAINNMS
jgi:cystathionine beta-lyase